MKDEYPELADVPEFEKCNVDELKFVWYYSVFYRLMKNETARIKLSVEAAFLKHGIWVNAATSKVREQYFEGNFPEDIRVAINKMANYDPGARVSAKLIAEATLRTYQFMISSISEDVLNEEVDSEGDAKPVDWDVRKKQVDTMATINKEIPNVLSQVETGFGIRKKDKNTIDYLGGLDKWHENNK